jgi:hypothetical protein
VSPELAQIRLAQFRRYKDSIRLQQGEPVNERITVTMAVSITVDPQAWYSEHRADPGVDIPHRMLTHLRMLPSIRDLDGKVELTRLVRRGRGCRQSPQHRAVAHGACSRSGVQALMSADLKRAHPGLSSALRLLHYLRRSVLAPSGRIPNKPSGNFL